MANSTAPVYIKPIVAFNRGDTSSSAPGSAPVAFNRGDTFIFGA
jgi:hypothetical protein